MATVDFGEMAIKQRRVRHNRVLRACNCLDRSTRAYTVCMCVYTYRSGSAVVRAAGASFCASPSCVAKAPRKPAYPRNICAVNGSNGSFYPNCFAIAIAIDLSVCVPQCSTRLSR